MSTNVGKFKKPSGNRWRKFLLLSAVPVMLAAVLGFASPASAATLNLNGTGPGIQSISSYPNNAMWVNVPTEYNVVPQGGGGGQVPGQVVNTATSYQTVTTPIYGSVLHQGSRWVNSGYFTTFTWWAETGYWQTGQTWVNSGYFTTFTWWAETGYWASGSSWDNSGYMTNYCWWAETGYWNNSNLYGWGIGIVAEYNQWGQETGWYQTSVPLYDSVWVSTAHEACDQHWISTAHWQNYSYWVSTAHWASDQHWISTAHWQNYSYWVSTAHWASDQHWISTAHWQTYTYWTTGIVGYSTSQVPVVTKTTDSNINLSNESLIGVQPEVRNTTTGQIVDGSFCTTPTTPLIAPTNSGFPDYSGTPWQYASFFSGQGICNINVGILPTTTFDQWAVAQQSVQLVLIPSWTATVSYNKVTTVNGSVTSSVPVTKVETVTGAPYTASTMPTKYVVGVVCAVQNGQSYCPGSGGN